MWCNTQTPFLARGRYATALGVPEAQVRVIQTEVKDKLSEEILFGKLQNGGLVSLDLTDEQLSFNFS